MAATHAVLHTYELVEAILAELPPFEVMPMKNVCTAWRDVVLKSAVLPTTKAIIPKSFVRREPVEFYASNNMMLFREDTRFEFNPSFRDRQMRACHMATDSHKLHNDHGDCNGIWAHIYFIDLLRFGSRFFLGSMTAMADPLAPGKITSAQYATLPPVARMPFECHAKGLRRDPRSAFYGGSLFNPSGITVGDLEGLCSRLLRNEGHELEQLRLEMEVFQRPEACDTICRSPIDFDTP